MVGGVHRGEVHLHPGELNLHILLCVYFLVEGDEGDAKCFCHWVRGELQKQVSLVSADDCPLLQQESISDQGRKTILTQMAVCQ